MRSPDQGPRSEADDLIDKLIEEALDAVVLAPSRRPVGSQRQVATQIAGAALPTSC